MTALDVAPEVRSGPPSDPGPGGRVVLALARVEAVRMLRHPITLAGLGLSALFSLSVIGPVAFVLARESITLQGVLVPLMAAVLVVAHLATTRPARDGVTPLVTSRPLSDAARTAALLLAIAGVAAAVLVLVVVVLVVMRLLGGVGGPDVLELLTAPAVIWLAGALGVGLGRVTRSRAASPLAVVALGALELWLHARGGDAPPTISVLAPIMLEAITPFDAAAVARPSGAHLLYVLGLVGVVSGVAFLPDRRVRPRALAAGALGAVVAIAAAVVQFQPPGGGEIERLTRRAVDPASISRCDEVTTGVTLCTLPEYGAWRGRWAPALTGVVAPLTAAGLSPRELTIVQRPPGYLVSTSLGRWLTRDRLPDALTTSAADHGELASGGGPARIDIGTTGYRGAAGNRAQLALALAAARTVMGIPAEGDETEIVLPSPDGGETLGTFIPPCSPAGQAREVLAVWLAAQATVGSARALGEVVDQHPYAYRAEVSDDGTSVAIRETGSQDTLGWIGIDTVPGPGPRWSKIAANHALALLDRDTDEVMSALAPAWDRWTDPTTPVRDLVDELGLDALPTGSQVPGADVIEASFLDGSFELREFRDTPLPAATPDDNRNSGLAPPCS